MSSENRAIVLRLYQEIWNKRSLEVISELVSPSHALHGPNFSGSAIGPEAYAGQVALFLAAFPDLRFAIEDTVAENDKVVACWAISGTHKGEFMGVPATGKRITIDGMTIHHIAGGKIMDSFSNWDALGFMQQIGVVAAPGQTKSQSAR